ncbi:MAG: hypothetical protein IKU20_08100 [Lachnospiraceae bacterium]|nr:hypothetical protein [Lachnospiraceae bacterium]
MKLNKKAIVMFLTGALAIASAFPGMATQTTNNAAAGSVQPAAQAVETWNPSVSAMNVICAPSGIMMMSDGTMVITDTYNKVVWRTKDRESTVIAGKLSAVDMYGQPIGGYNDSTLTESYFKKPWAVTKYLNGIAVSDSENNVIRYIGNDGIETAVGNGTAGFRNGHGMDTAFNNPTGLATDPYGNLYVADTNNNAIRRVTKYGDVKTYIDNITEPTGLFWKGDILYVAASGSHQILKVKDGVIVETIGTGTEGDVIGAAAQAQFSFPQGVTVADDGSIYVSDTGNSAIKKIANGTVTTLLMCDYAKMDMYPITPQGLAVYGDKLYVCDNFAKKVIILNR